MNMRGDRCVATNATLKTLVQFAYFRPNNPLLNYQIVGGPNWIETDRFDIEAHRATNLVVGQKSPFYPSLKCSRGNLKLLSQLLFVYVSVGFCRHTTYG